MTRRIKASGPNLPAALRSALAELADCDPEKVEIRLQAPGFDPDGDDELELRLRVEAAPDDVDGPDKAQTGEQGDDGSEDDEITPEESARHLDEEAEAAADFMEELLDLMQLPGDLKIRLFEDYAEVEVVDVGSGVLIGRRGQTLEAIQELLRCSLQRQFQRRTRVKVDVEAYRTRRLEKFLEKAEDAIDEVLDTGEPQRLEPMDVFERKTIHQMVAEVDGVSSHSQGREPGRRIVIEPVD